MLKKIGASAGLVILAIVIVVLICTALFTSKQVRVTPVPRIDIDVKGAAERFAGALRYKTISDRDFSRVDTGAFDGFYSYLDREFPLVRANLKKEIVNGYSILYTWKGSDPKAKPILLMGHSDVVPVEPGTEKDWKYPPFAGKIAEGSVWGRGAQDVKVSVMGVLEAFEYLLAKGYKPKRTICMAIGHTEEVRGENGNGKIVELLKSRGVRFEAVVDEGGFLSKGMIGGIKSPVAIIGTAEKGYLSIEFAVTSEGGHSSMPPKETAVGILCTAISRLEKNPFPLRISGVTKQMLQTVGPEMPFGNKLALANLWLLGRVVKSQLGGSNTMAATMHTTIAPTMLQGSVRENVLPIKATAVVNFRIMPGETIAEVMDRVRAVIKDDRVKLKALPEAMEPSPVTDMGLPAYKTLERTIREVFPGVVVSPFLMVAATDSRLYIPVSESILRFTPRIETSETLGQMHGTNEHLGVDNYGDIVRFFVQLVKNMDAKQPERP